MNHKCPSIIVVLLSTTFLPAAEPNSNSDRQPGHRPNASSYAVADADPDEYDLFYELLNGSGRTKTGFAEQAKVPFAEDAQVDGLVAHADLTEHVAESGAGQVRAAKNLEVAQNPTRKAGARTTAPQPSYLPNLKPLRSSGTNKAKAAVMADEASDGELTLPEPKRSDSPAAEKLPPPLASQGLPQPPLEVGPHAYSDSFGMGYNVHPDDWLRQKIQACNWNPNESQLHKWIRNQRRNRQLFGVGGGGTCGADGCPPNGHAGWGSSSWVAPWTQFTSSGHCEGGSCNAGKSCDKHKRGRGLRNTSHNSACWGEAGNLDHGWLLSRHPERLALGGWVAVSGNGNMTDPQVVPYNGPVTFVDQANDFQMNQLYMYLERPVRDRGVSVGGRVDLLYGTDSRFVLANGLDDKITLDRTSPDYKLAIPQLYAEAGLGPMSVKFGHFYTILGYEVVPAPENFFITHSYSKQYAEPFTHTGMLTKLRLGKQWTVLGGVTRGWNNWSDNNNDLDVLAGINWVNSRRELSFCASVTSGNQDDAGINNRTVGTVLMGAKLTDRMDYVLQTDLGYEENATARGQDAEWYSVVNYLTYALNDCVTIGTRLEWFSDDDGVRVMGLGPPQGSSVLPHPAHWQEAALGVIVQPTRNILIRNELRWDWLSAIDGADYRPFDDFSSRSQALWTTDMIVGF